ncbi:uncharacterized protein BDZ99DRAFT_467122 [Mytilinidion resinicola]|uniref:2EXR domain-containing protein n=1 Tax=Mytilinidion resinicola TaxID=574789 RepID=A0A6A6Y8J8_9PEZI|nr:uncharacterized protein BDZ99DRAFT_467122 [Mytilinidion resinicola]KAF2804883.1 hypothetical protein BDZ99DRAFT_467122 [Mytilinidion resinicola]
MARTKKSMSKKKRGVSLREITKKLHAMKKLSPRVAKTSKSAQATTPKKTTAKKEPRVSDHKTPKTKKPHTPKTLRTLRTKVAKTSKPAQTPNSPGTSFMNLSGELRNMIYDHALVYPSKVQVSWGTTKKPRSHHVARGGAYRPPTGVPALLQVCRQVRQEGLSIFYSANTFAFHEDHDVRARDPRFDIRMIGSVWYVCTRPTTWRFERWLTSLGDNVRWLRHIHLCFHTREAKGLRVRYQGDFFPWVKFAAQHPEADVVVASGENDVHHCCGCYYADRPGEVAKLAEKFPVLREPAWVEEIRAGNIRGFVGETVTMGGLRTIQAQGPWEVQVKEITYSEQVREAMDEDDWQEVCEKLSLSHSFTLVRKSAKGKGNFGMIVEAKPEVIVLDD